MSVGVQAQIRRNAECLRDYFRDLDEWQKECNSRKNTVSGKLKVCKRQDEFRIDLRSHQGEGTDTSHDFKNLDEQTVSDALSAKGVQEHISGSSSAKYKCADHVKVHYNPRVINYFSRQARRFSVFSSVHAIAGCGFFSELPPVAVEKWRRRRSGGTVHFKNSNSRN